MQAEWVTRENDDDRACAKPERADPVATQERAVSESSAPLPWIGLDGIIAQAKTSVGPADDAYEREADAVASRVVQILRSESSIVERGGDSGAPVGRIRRSVASERPSPPARSVTRVQRAQTIGAGGGDVDDETNRMLTSSRSGGKPLPDEARSKMERAFGTDFSGVRVHSGPVSTELNNRIQAKAFTTGNDVYFRDAMPDTSTSSGQELLAHELTHTIQQRGAEMRRAAAPPPIQRKIGHHADVGDEVYGSEDGEYGGVRGNIVKKVTKKRAGMQVRLPRMGGGFRISNPLPSPRVLSTKKGHNTIAKEVDHYIVQTRGETAGTERVAPLDEDWESVKRDNRKAVEGSTMTEKAAAGYATARSKAAGHAERYEEFGGGGKIAIVAEYGEDLAKAVGELGAIVAKRLAVSKRYGIEIAPKWQRLALTAADYLSKSLSAVSKLIEQLSIPEPTIQAIQKALKAVKKLLETLVLLAQAYQTGSNSQAEILLSLNAQAAETGYAQELERIATEIQTDDNLKSTVKETVPAQIMQMTGLIAQGLDALTSAETMIRQRLGGSAAEA